MEETQTKKARRGFSAMNPEKQREIASKGGKAAHAMKRAHEFTPEEARAAGRKGGQTRAANVKAKLTSSLCKNHAIVWSPDTQSFLCESHWRDANVGGKPLRATPIQADFGKFCEYKTPLPSSLNNQQASI